MMRLAELTNKVLNFPKTNAAAPPAQGTRWGLIAGAVALVVLVVAAWYAGRASGALDEQRLRADLNSLMQQIASTQLELAQQTAKTNDLEKTLRSSGKNVPTADQPSVIRSRLLQAQARADQYKAILDREQQSMAENTRLLDALRNHGAHLFVLKGSEAAAQAVVYALLIEKSKLLFICSNLPKLEEERQFQLWVVRKQDPKVVSAGVFSPDADDRAVIGFDEASLLSDVSSFRVTDEPNGGSSMPTGAKLLEGVVDDDE